MKTWDLEHALNFVSIVLCHVDRVDIKDKRKPSMRFVVSLRGLYPTCRSIRWPFNCSNIKKN